jgi:hypothetical protein
MASNCHIMQGIPFLRQPGGCLRRYHCESKVIIGPRECNQAGIIRQSKRHLLEGATSFIPAANSSGRGHCVITRRQNKPVTRVLG